MGKAHTSTGIQEIPIITHLDNDMESPTGMWGHDFWLDDMETEPPYDDYME